MISGTRFVPSRDWSDGVPCPCPIPVAHSAIASAMSPSSRRVPEARGRMGTHRGSSLNWRNCCECPQRDHRSSQGPIRAHRLSSYPYPTQHRQIGGLRMVQRTAADQRPQNRSVRFDDSARMLHVHPPVAAVTQLFDEIASMAWTRPMTENRGENEPNVTIRIACRPEPRVTMVAAPEGTTVSGYGRAAA